MNPGIQGITGKLLSKMVKIQKNKNYFSFFFKIVSGQWTRFGAKAAKWMGEPDEPLTGFYVS